MIWHPFLAVLAAFLGTLYNLLPPWTFHLTGDQTGASSDYGGVAAFISWLGTLDRFIPIHDALVPMVGVQLAITLGLLVFKAIKFVLSLIPTISAGG